MSTENVRRFVERVAQDSRLAERLKTIPAGPRAEADFVALAAEEGFAFNIDELRAEAEKAASGAQQRSESAATAEVSESGESADWVLDYFYGPNGQWTK